jgi:hypothetical protein
VRSSNRRNPRGRQSRAHATIPVPGFAGLIADLAADLGVGPKEVATAVALIRSGRSDLITAVMAGRMTVRAAADRAGTDRVRLDKTGHRS